MASTVPLTKANASFFLDMLKKLGEENKKESVCFAPFGLSAALAMVLLGAKGNTAKQISEVLRLTDKQSKSFSATPLQSLLQTRSQARSQMHTQMQMQIRQRSKLPSYLNKVLNAETDKDEEQADKVEEHTPKDENKSGEDKAQNGGDVVQTGEEDSKTEKDDGQDDVHAKFAELLSQFIKDDAPCELSLANRLYGEKSQEFLKEFLEDVKKHYKSELEPVDFKGNVETERVNINSWVEKQTQEKIKDLLPEGSLTNTTKLVLINAVCFKSLWDKKFEVEENETQFKVNKTDTKPVKMIRQISPFHLRSIPEIKSQIIEIPYKGEGLSMFIILPDAIEDETTGLEKLEKELTFEKFVEWTRPAVEEENAKVDVEVKLPQFKMEKTYNLKGSLIGRGMVDAFNEKKSDLSGISPQKDLALSRVVHRAVMEVDETGSEAPASSPAAGTPTKVFIADHPFLFFVRHKPTKTVLVAGRYSSPE